MDEQPTTTDASGDDQPRDGWEALRPELWPLYRRGQQVIREGWSGGAVFALITKEAEALAIKTSDAVDVALRVLNLPAADPNNAIVCAATPGDRFFSETIERPRSVLGDGLLLAGDLGILYGRPGLGKSWLLAQLAAAAVDGLMCLGFSVDRVRVGIISLEGHDFFLKSRLEIALRELYGEDWIELARNLSIITRRRLGRRLDLLEDAEALARWIDSEGLSLVLPDPLSKLHQVRETAEELGPVIDAGEDIAASTKSAILVSTHERKGSPGGGRKSEDDDLDALRGTTRLTTDPRVLIRLKAVHGHAGLRVLVFPKVSYAAPPEPIYLRPRDDLEGYLEPTEKPASERKADKRRDDLKAALANAAGNGLSVEEAKGITGLTSDQGARNALRRAGGVPRGSGPTARWYLPDRAPSEPQEDLL